MKTTKDAVKKWPMNDFLIALEKVFEEHGAGLMVRSNYICAVSGSYQRLDTELHKNNIGRFINDKCRPENQMKGQKMACNINDSSCECPCCKYKFKEQKMEKQKYKYVNAAIKTVGELYDRIDTDDNGCFVGEEQLCIIVDGCSISFESKLEPLSLGEIKQLLPNITTRQPLPWYEVEGAFPCLVKYSRDMEVYIAKGADFEKSRIITVDNGRLDITYCAPLSSEEAAKYGVDCE